MFAALKKKLAKKSPDNPVVLPSNVKVKTDTVSYETIHNKTEQSNKYSSAACYSQHMRNLSDYLFTCKPNGTFTISNEDYMKWMELCYENHLLPIAAEWYIEKKKPYARIPGGNVGRHQVYTALCCYRFAESNGPFVYSVLRLIEEKPELDFFQCVHFGMSKHVAHIGHSFSHMCNATYAMYGMGGKCRNDLIHSIGMKWFYLPDKKGESVCTSHKKNNTSNTNDLLQQYCVGLKVKVPIKNIGDALNPKYTPLYKVKVGDVETLSKLVAEIK